MRLSWKLGRVSGIDLYLHPSALIIFWIVSQSYAQPLRAVPLVIGLFASIVLHELGHALAARRYGIGTQDITLYLFGGVARLERFPRSAGPELLIALAGPAVNIVLVGGLAMVAAVARSISPSIAGLSLSLIYINLALALFNLLPIFPMDGGRVFRALLTGWLGRLRATEVAATVGQGLALLGGLAFLLSGNWQAAILAGFVFFQAGLEREQVRFESRPIDVPQAPRGFRWSQSVDGVWRLVPTAMAGGGRSWT